MYIHMEINILCIYSMLQKRLKGPQRGWGGERVRGVMTIYQTCIVHKKGGEEFRELILVIQVNGVCAKLMAYGK